MKRKLTPEEIKTRYVSQKTRDLQEFGYPDLTREEVAERYDKVLAGEEVQDVIGLIVKKDFDDAREK